MQVFHRGGAEDDEETHPEGGPLERNGLVRLSFFRLVVSLEDDGIEKEGEETEDEKELNEEDGQVLGMVLDAASGLRCQHLIDIVKVDPARKEEDDKKDSGDLYNVGRRRR